ncbi:C45 family autoproteolytic acyltransferase/hydolase [Herbiconiux sp.]|uniref:C45 family autoproteolytic acyltransferase/hydolase n=1 Tax=Herbiconiux sp. TaxID=1871186 RepID=UPI0025C56137|nr:C45 family autoproteolytic acyltransferase/hydolase [Herbiconiux sp.]
MTVHRFVSTETDPFRRGIELGRFGAVDIRANIDIYTELFRTVGVTAAALREQGGESIRRIRDWAPELEAELRGVAEGSGVPLESLGMLNARTEVLAIVGETGEGECSTVVSVPDGAAPRSMQTWDWHDESNANTLVVEHPRAGGGTVKYFTEFGLLGKIGLNSDGLGVHFNILNNAADGDHVGVPVHAVARQILEEASTVAEAIAIARSAEVTASTVLTVTTFDGERGDAACIELSPERTAVIPVDDSRLLVHTNHFLDEQLAAGELSLDRSSTYPRRRMLAERAEVFAGADPVDRALAMVIHQEDGAAVCCHPDPALPPHLRWESLITIGLDLQGTTLQFHDSRPCQVRRESWQSF